MGRDVQPALGAKGVGVRAEERGVALDDPGVAADDGTAGDEVVENVHALRGHDALEDQAWGGVEAEGLLNNGVEVGELLGLGPRHGFIGARGDGAGAGGGVEFVNKGGVDAWVVGKEVEDCGEGNCGGLRASEDDGGAGGEDACVVHESMVMAGLGESGE